MGSNYSDAIDYLDPAMTLKQLERLLKKLKIQFFFCFFGILLTIWVYTTVRSKNPCCELPFRNNSCAARSVIPPTTHSTLADEVDGFLAALRAKTSNLQKAVEMPLFNDRQKTFENTKEDFLQLIQRHSANLAAFRAIEKEDQRIEKMGLAVANSYATFSLFIMFGSFNFAIMAIMMDGSIMMDKLFTCSSPAMKELSAEGSDNLRNARLNKLKTRIPIFYLATLLCVMVEFGLCASFLAGQYYTGSCPIPAGKTEKNLKAEEKCLTTLFADFHTFADKLQSTLDEHLAELSKSMQSPILEVRELGWKYEHNAIEAAFRSHSELKQQLIDRNVIPREISYAPRGPELIGLGLALALIIFVFVVWAPQEGSIWQPCQFAKYYSQIKK
ncbi:hypothetical protein Ddc_10213 [Ditylenchus destructor]|nr:hypothetical protein Ddc_10213 [Ditylenchus destructor]